MNVLRFGVISDAAQKALSARTAKGLRSGLPKLGQLLERPSRGGYGFRQAMSGDSDAAYTASIGALKACLGVTLDRPSALPRLAFAFPVIVVNTPLFECVRKPDGQLELTSVESSEFLFSAYIPSHVGCCIRVVTSAYLPDFANEAKVLADAIREDLHAEEREIIATAL